MIEINWDPTLYIGPIPIHWYGITWLLGFVVGAVLTWRWAPKFQVPREKIEGLISWILVASLIGARLYFIIQNDPAAYFGAPWRILAIWEGGLAYFGGLFGGMTGAFIYTLRHRLSFLRTADLFAPAILIGSAIGRITCGLAGMDYGTQTTLPWGVIYRNPNSYAANDGVARHPDQYYELLGDVLIAFLLIKLRGKLANGGLFFVYLVLFSLLRFFVFFARGNVDVVALGLKNAQLTALGTLAAAFIGMLIITLRRRSQQQFAS